MDFLEERRKKYFPRLKDICYLDHVGCGLYAESQIEAVMQELKCNVYGNPHSANSVSTLCKDSVDQVRNRILKYLNTDMNSYSVVFTSGATAAMKLVVENFDWTEKPQEDNRQNESGNNYFVYTRDNHTSVLGLAQLVKQNNVEVKSLTYEDMWGIFETRDKPETLTDEDSSKSPFRSLFIYSAECNFSGVKNPLDWIEKCHEGCLNEYCDSGRQKRSMTWYCLIDAATYMSTNELDLNKYKPDFVTISFYKIFGYPTGLGALLVRNSSSKVLKKKYFGGGAVKIALSDGSFHQLRNALHERFEDGTISYLSILALNHGFNAINHIGGGMKTIQKMTFNLAQYLFLRLLKLHHNNGEPAAVLYADTDYSSYQNQGAIVNFNMLRDNGEFIGYMEVLNLANLHGIQLRTGCFCNPGACQRHLQISNDQLKANYEAGHICGDGIDLLNGYPTGSIRVSFGYSSTKGDADELIEMLIHCFVTKPFVEKIPVSWKEQSKKLKRKVVDLNALQSNLKSEKKSIKNSFLIQEKQGEIFFNPTQNIITRSSKPKFRLKKIFLYPVKSCGFLEVTDSWEIDKNGLQYDRMWMIIGENGVPLTQKYDSTLCMIKPAIDFIQHKLVLSHEGIPNSVSVPLDILENSENDNNSTEETISLCQSKVCEDNVTIKDCGNKVAKWLSLALQRDNLRLVRLVTRDQKGDKESEKLNLSLSNQGQYLLVNETSLDWLKKLVKENGTDLSKENLMHRFRCNLVLSRTNEAFEELKWTQLKIGRLKFKVDGPCTRCQMICIDQQSGEKTKEPLTTLAAGLKGKIQFGVYLSMIKDEKLEKRVLRIKDEIVEIKV